MIYLGSFGRMIGIKCPSSQSVQTADRHTFDQTLEGRVKAQARPRGRRTWSLQTSEATTPEQHTALSAFAEGYWGNGPFWFFSADAVVTNMLPPDNSRCAVLPSHASPSISIAGPVQLPGGAWAPKSFRSINPAANMWHSEIQGLPVTPGQTVTVSAYAQGEGCRVYAFFTDATGAEVSRTPSPSVGVPSELRRLSATAVVPAGAVAVGLYSIGTTRGAAPAVTLTDTVQPWSDGQGCSKAVVSSFSRDQTLAVVGRTYSNVSFTVTEVG